MASEYDIYTYSSGDNLTELWLESFNDADNSSTNGTDSDEFVNLKYATAPLVFICFILGMMILVTIIGNVFVIAAIILERSLQAVSNYLILSLAVTDLMVAVLVMPLSVVNEITLTWHLGNELCDMWISFDILCCTGSILHLVAISFDRFWAVSDIDYIRRRNARKILTLVAAVWIVAICVSIPPLFGWREDDNSPEVTGYCQISQDQGYTIYSTVGAFYCPLVLMLVLNYKIYKAARSRIRKKAFGGAKKPKKYDTAAAVPSTKVIGADGVSMNVSSGSDVDSHDGYSSFNGSCLHLNEISQVESSVDLREEENGLMENDSDVSVNPTARTSTALAPSTLSPPPLSLPGRKSSTCKIPKPASKLTPRTPTKCNNNNKMHRKKEKERLRKEKIEMKRERKAARVLGIITGAFVVCWLPFFVIALIGPFCGNNCYFPDAMISVFLWLGYFNSLLNPVIYTIFNPSFRTAFRKLLFGKYRKVRIKVGR